MTRNGLFKNSNQLKLYRNLNTNSKEQLQPAFQISVAGLEGWVAQWLKALSAFPEDLVPSTHVGWLTTIQASEDLMTYSELLRHSTYMCIDIEHGDTYT